MKGFDPNSNSPDRVRRALQKIGTGGATGTIKVTAPLVNSSSTLGITRATGTANGYLSSTDWTTFNNKVPSTRTIATTAPLTGGGDLSADRTLSIAQASSTTNGYLSSTDWTAFHTGGASSPTYGLKNRLMNGNFDFWQRGTGGFSTVGYSADRWRIAVADPHHSVSQTLFSPGILGSTVQASLNLEIDLGQSANPFTLEQRIESVKVLAGVTATLSFWMKGAGSRAPQTVTVSMVQHFGSGGAPSADVTTAVGTLLPTGSWVRYPFTVAVPSVSGKNLGSNNDDYVSLQLAFLGPGVGSGTGYNLAQVQFEPGSTATDFEWRPLVTELLLCQRYYERSYALSQVTGAAGQLGPAIIPNSISALAASVAGNVGNGSFLGFKVEKRKAPTIVLYDFSGNVNGTRVNNATAGDVNRDGATAGPVNASGALQFLAYDNSGTAPITVGSCIFAHWTADAEI